MFRPAIQHFLKLSYRTPVTIIIEVALNLRFKPRYIESVSLFSHPVPVLAIFQGDIGNLGNSMAMSISAVRLASQGCGATTFALPEISSIQNVKLGILTFPDGRWIFESVHLKLLAINMGIRPSSCGDS